MDKKLVRAIFSPKMLVTFAMGFASGLPLLLTKGTLSAWMTEEGIDLTVIGIFALVGMPYSLKFIWAPLLDRYVPPFLGRRRGWLAITQGFLAISLWMLGMFPPSYSIGLVATLAFVVAFFSATQDIAVDAYRREDLKDEEMGLGSSLYVNGYRVAMIISGGGALLLADHFSWSSVYMMMGLLMALNVVTTFLCKEPKVRSVPKSLKEAVIDPFVEYFSRDGAVIILLFILLYKFGDNLASQMLVPFYLKTGFSKTEIGLVSKIFGLWSTIVGALLAGILLIKIGIKRGLWIFGILQMVSTAGFAVLSYIGPSVPALAVVIAIENLAGGMGTAAFMAYMMSLTNKKFTATQYALLTSFMAAPRDILTAPSGFLAKSLGWSPYFILCTLIAIPGLLLIRRVTRN